MTRSCRSLLLLQALFALVLTSGCSSIDVDQYEGVEPKIDLFTFFSGDLTASGIVRNRSGKVVRHFNADIRAYLEGEVLVLDETFLFNDGEEDTRIWRIKKLSEGHYTGRANDTVGDAVGRSAGNAVRWKYAMVLSVDGRDIKVDFDDWIFQTSSNTLINVTDIKKWGFKVGEVVLVISK